MLDLTTVLSQQTHAVSAFRWRCGEGKNTSYSSTSIRRIRPRIKQFLKGLTDWLLATGLRSLQVAAGNLWPQKPFW